MTVWILALRGIAAVLVLTTLVGGIPRIAQGSLALGLGVWSALLVGGAPPASWEIAGRELAIGASLGVLAAIPLLAAAFAGRLADVAAWGRSRGPYELLFGILAAAVFVGIDGHVAVITAIVESFRAMPVLADTRTHVLASIAVLVPAAARLAVPWLVTAAVVQVAIGASNRLAGRAAAGLPAGAAVPAALAVMTAAFVGTLAVALAALVRGILA
jgi:flagellar biosynthesis protein FliR